MRDGIAADAQGARVPAPAAPACAPGGPAAITRLYHIPLYWSFIAPGMITALLPALLTVHSGPGLAVKALAAAGIVLAAATRLFIRLERGLARGAAQRALAMVLGIGGPMLLYGLAAAGWAREQGNPLWIGAVGMAVLSGTFAAVLLARRPPAMLTALTALWLPVVASAGRVECWAIFVCGLAGGVTMVWRQTAITNAAMARRRQQERVQQRAYDILVDYEKTGQGWFWETDREGRITYLSPGLSEAFGCPVEELFGRPFVELFAMDVTGNESAATGLNLHFSTRTAFRDVVVSVAGPGTARWWSISGSPTLDRFGVYFGFRGFGWDQTERRRSQEHSSRLAHYDSLTGVASRLQMTQSLETILNAPDPTQRRCAILLIDLDRFKQVNDTLGHPVGDAVLKQAAGRLRRVVGARGRIGRLGGDEFQIILPGPQDRDELAVLAERVIARLSRPYVIEGQRARIGASIGIALAPQDGVTSDTLVGNADLALYAAKDAGRGGFHFYTADLHSNAEERRQLEEDLRDAVASGALELWYQPVIHTITEAVTGFEALLRWNHPRLGRLSPAKFVPIAEEIGLIAQIGEWALRTACRDLAAWPDTIRVAVNLSPLQFANPSLPAIVTNALASAQVAPGRLELEITERVFLNEDAATDAMFAALKRIGVRLALDDFGTGYSSIGYLEAAPFDRIKIDQSFVRGAAEPGSRNAAVLASIVGLAEALGMETTAEGIETPQELELVRLLGCSHVQGFIYEAPLSLPDSVAHLAKRLSEPGGDAGVPRNAMLRKAVIAFSGQRRETEIRTVAVSGGVFDCPGAPVQGTEIMLYLAEDYPLAGTVRWSDESSIAVDFAEPLMVATPREIQGPAFARVSVETATGIRRAG